MTMTLSFVVVVFVSMDHLLGRVLSVELQENRGSNTEETDGNQAARSELDSLLVLVNVCLGDPSLLNVRVLGCGLQNTLRLDLDGLSLHEYRHVSLHTKVRFSKIVYKFFSEFDF